MTTTGSTDGVVGTIVHVSDIHIRLLARHEEFRHVFHALHAEIRQIKQARKVHGRVVAVVTGDVFHTKVELSPESLMLAYEFFEMLSAEVPTLVIAGNHDALLCNQDRQDNLSAVFARGKNENLLYMKHSGIYPFFNLDVHVFSVLDTPDKWPSLEQEGACNQVTDAQRPKVALYHGAVGRFQLQNNTVFSCEESISMKERLRGYDMVLLGDIHQWQFVGPRMAYAGSLLAQNEGERRSEHGFLVWDVPRRDAIFRPLWNDFAYVELTILADGRLHRWDQKDCSLEEMLEPSKSALRLPSKGRCALVYSDKALRAMVLRYQAKLRIMYPNLTLKCIESLTAVGETNATDAKGCALKDDNELPHDMQMETIMTRYWMETFASSSDGFTEWMADMMQYYKSTFLGNNQSDDTVARAQWVSPTWSITRLSVTDMFGYGPLSLTWSNGVFAVLGENSSGKSSLIDILTMLLFGRCTRHTGRQTVPAEVIRHHRNKASGCIWLQCGSDDVEIRRTFSRSTTTGKVKMDVVVFVNGKNVTLRERRETDQWLAKRIGSLENFVFLSCHLQHRQRGFAEMSQKERKEFLFEHLSLHGWERCYQDCHAVIRELQVQLEVSKRSLDGMDAMTPIATELDRVQDAFRRHGDEIACLTAKREQLFQVLHEEGGAPTDSVSEFFSGSMWRSAMEQRQDAKGDDDTADVETADARHATGLERLIEEWMHAQPFITEEASSTADWANCPVSSTITALATTDAHLAPLLPPARVDDAEVNKARFQEWRAGGVVMREKLQVLEMECETWRTRQRGQEREAIERQEEMMSSEWFSILTDSGRLWDAMDESALGEMRSKLEQVITKRSSTVKRPPALSWKALDRVRGMIERAEQQTQRDNECVLRAITQCERHEIAYLHAKEMADAHVDIRYDPDNCQACRENPFRHQRDRLLRERDSLEAQWRRGWADIRKQMHALEGQWSEARDAWIEEPLLDPMLLASNIDMLSNVRIDSGCQGLREAWNEVIGHRTQVMKSHLSIVNDMVQLGRCQHALQHRVCARELEEIRQRVFPCQRELEECWASVQWYDRFHDTLDHLWTVWSAWAEQRQRVTHERSARMDRERQVFDQLCRHYAQWTAEKERLRSDQEAWRTRHVHLLQQVDARLLQHRHEMSDCSVRLQSLEAARAQRVVLQTQVDELARRLERVARVERSLHRDGLPSFILKMYFEFMTANWNELISPFLTKRVSLTLVKDEVVWSLHPVDADEVVENPSFLGGMESFVMDISMRLVFHQLSQAPKCAFFVIDEGVSVLDRSRLADISVLTNFLRTHFATSWIVTHIEQLRDFVDGEHLVLRDAQAGHSTVVSS